MWWMVWWLYDRPLLVRLLPAAVAPWLTGKMLGVKGTPAALSAEEQAALDRLYD